jgi:hypothetical protein
MWQLSLWLYVVTATLLSVHEIDSAYWKEWELFHLPGGLDGFLIIHIPLMFAVIIGVVYVHEMTSAGAVFSLLLSGGGVFAFGIHTYFLSRGCPEFRRFVSRTVLCLLLISSLALAGVQLLIFNA